MTPERLHNVGKVLIEDVGLRSVLRGDNGSQRGSEFRKADGPPGTIVSLEQRRRSETLWKLVEKAICFQMGQ